MNLFNYCRALGFIYFLLNSDRFLDNLYAVEYNSIDHSSFHMWFYLTFLSLGKFFCNHVDYNPTFLDSKVCA